MDAGKLDGMWIHPASRSRSPDTVLAGHRASTKSKKCSDTAFFGEYSQIYSSTETVQYPSAKDISMPDTSLAKRSSSFLFPVINLAFRCGSGSRLLRKKPPGLIVAAISFLDGLRVVLLHLLQNCFGRRANGDGIGRRGLRLGCFLFRGRGWCCILDRLRLRYGTDRVAHLEALLNLPIGIMSKEFSCRCANPRARLTLHCCGLSRTTAKDVQRLFQI
jgi:hypothetical protein